MINDIYELYNKVNGLIIFLEDKGDLTYSEKLKIALAGSTSGEILGALFLYLKELDKKAKYLLDIEKEELVNEMKHYLSKILS